MPLPLVLLSWAGEIATVVPIVVDWFGRSSDERALPLWRDDATECDLPDLVGVGAAQGAFQPAGAPLHAEMREALDRVEVLASVGQACKDAGLITFAADKLRTFLLTSGVMPADRWPLGKLIAKPGDRGCFVGARVKRGEAQALIARFAAEVADACAASRVEALGGADGGAALVEAAGKPLDDRGALKARFPWLVPVALGLVGLLILWGLR